MTTKAKIIHEKNKKKSNKKKNAFIEKSIPYLIGLVLILIIIVSLQVFGVLDKPQTDTSENSLLVTVNNHSIYQQDLDKYWEELTAEQKMSITKEQLLESIIIDHLLFDEAKQRGLEVSYEDALVMIEEQVSQMGMSLEELQADMELEGLNFEEVLKAEAKQMSIFALLEEDINPDAFNIDAQEVEEFYTEHKEEFKHDGVMTIRHILLMPSEEQNISDLDDLVASIISELDEQENNNFCELVSEYTMDLASKDSCGEYAFIKGVMTPAFEEAAWNMSVGERRVIESEYGYHIMLKMNEVLAGYFTLEEQHPVMNEINFFEYIEQYLLEEKTMKIYQEYVLELKNDAEITYEA